MKWNTNPRDDQRTWCSSYIISKRNHQSMFESCIKPSHDKNKPQPLKESSLPKVTGAKPIIHSQSQNEDDQSELFVSAPLLCHARWSFVNFAKDLREFIVRKKRLEKAFKYDVDESLVERLMLEHAENENNATKTRLRSDESLQVICIIIKVSGLQ